MSDQAEYIPPSVWQWNKDNGGRFANINRPIAGSTHQKDLPVGKHPFQLNSLATPNGVKITVMLEELLALGHSGAEYDAWLIRINEGDQFGSGFVAINPTPKFRHCPITVARLLFAFLSPVRSLCISLRSLARFTGERRSACGMSVMAVLANGQRTLSRRRVRPFLRLCAYQD